MDGNFIGIFSVSMSQVEKIQYMLPNIASVNNATNPIASMNQGNGSMKYVTIAPTSQRASMKSKYD